MPLVLNQLRSDRRSDTVKHANKGRDTVATEVLAADRRLTVLDRVRLTLGSTNLRRYSVRCSAQHQQVAAGSMCPVQESYDGRSLWTLFTRSEIGFGLDDSSLDLSFLALLEPSQNEVKVEPLPLQSITLPSDGLVE